MTTAAHAGTAAGLAPPRVAFRTLGCRLNQAETAQMAAAFEAAGYQVVPYGGPCEVCVIHTCSITARAEQKCLMLARAARRRTASPLVVLAGCAVDLAGEALKDRCGADLIVRRDAKFDIPALLEFSRREAVTGEPRATPLPRFETTRALIKVQDGCDFRCAYCVVPLARGCARSRPEADILNEVRGLTDAGYREVVLTGANLGCYENGSRRLVDLIEAIEQTTPVSRIRLSSIESTTAERAVLDYMASSSKLCRYLHIPLQSGDDAVLTAMGRRYTAKQYRDLVHYAVARVPDLGLGTDVLVGFPGEDERAFSSTIDLINDLPFSNLHIFPYSRRPGTRAAQMPGQAGDTIKKERCAQLKTLGQAKRSGYASRFAGRQVEVLIEKVTDQNVGSGWTSERIEARMQRPGLKPNQLVTFRPTRAADGILYA